MRLFHFSEDPSLALFAPRPVRVPVEGRAAWLNGPLVWAIDEAHSFLYFFPRDCPRILIWPTARSTAADRQRWMGETAARAVAYVEASWLDRLKAATVYRYDLPVTGFEDIGDVGMWVSRTAVQPLRIDAFAALDRRLAEADVELRVLEELTPLRDVLDSTLHASGIRLRNARNWPAPGWPHSKPIVT
ncbi:MAG TPA: hypothetical protein VHZ78_14110 [Rhizomicrobium sp.]|nr:hypothetical protein [Rhizomicrobium sp.]